MFSRLCRKTRQVVSILTNSIMTNWYSNVCNMQSPFSVLKMDAHRLHTTYWMQMFPHLMLGKKCPTLCLCISLIAAKWQLSIDFLQNAIWIWFLQQALGCQSTSLRTCLKVRFQFLQLPSLLMPRPDVTEHPECIFHTIMNLLMVSQRKSCL